jgi:OOP family OmpA-OmpF porin
MKKILPGSLLLLLFNLSSAQVVQWADKVIEFSSEMTSVQYSASQILGKPNVMPYGGQNPSAWTPDRKGKKEWIKVGFPNPMEIQQVAIAESANPSALYRVLAYDATGKEHLLYTFNPGPVPKLGMMRNVFFEKTAFKVAAIKLEFDGAAVSDFFSIDAIGISNSPYLIVADLNIPKLMAKGILVERLDENVNSEATEINPILSPDGKTLYFSRRNHPENIGGVADKEDIWFSELGEDGKWQLAKNMGPQFNNPGPNFVSAVNSATPDGKSVVMILGNKYEPNGKMLAGVSMSDNVNGTWTQPKSIEIENDYNYNEKANYFMANTRKTLMLSVEREDSRGSRDLYVSFMKPDSTWTEPVNLGDAVNTASEESAPFLANDNETLYFASNGFSGFGGADIYVSKRLDDTWQNWSEPQNLGPDVNSKLDDLFFNIPVNSDYAYYSRGITAENADIFRVKLPIYRPATPMVTVRGKLVDAKTGLPIAAKIFFESLPDGTLIGTTNTDPKTGEYEYQLPAGKQYTVRAEADGHMPQSHVVDLRNVTEEGKTNTENFALDPAEVMITVRGKLVDAKTGEPIYAKVIFETLPDGTLIGTVMTDPKTGEYEYKIPAGKLYSVRAEADGHLPQSHTVDLRNVMDANKVDVENFSLSPISVTLNTVLFKFNKATLMDQSYNELKRFAELMKVTPAMQAEIAGHTDATGDDNYNTWLSQWRAEAVANYLVEQGVDKARLKVTYFGETQPIDTNDTFEGRTKNRRVEFKVVKP